MCSGEATSEYKSIKLSVRYFFVLGKIKAKIDGQIMINILYFLYKLGQKTPRCWNRPTGKL